MGLLRAKNGVTCNPNIPTEEVFTTPHRPARFHYMFLGKPLSYQGTLIDDISVARFGEGRIVDAGRIKGADVLNRCSIPMRARAPAGRDWRWCHIPPDLEERHSLL